MQDPMTVDLGGVQMDFVWIPAGEFDMGATHNDAEPAELPVHRVTITKGFWLGTYAVTQKQWVHLMTTNPSSSKGENIPVQRISWNDCQEFLQRLRRKVQEHQTVRIEFRLPTEAEWEYACRAGTSTQFNTGDTEADLDRAGWFSGNSSASYPAGLKAPNTWGLYDMHGNVWEWCHDLYGPYSAGTVTDPSGATTGPTFRVIRGGSSYNPAKLCRSSFRAWFGQSMAYGHNGVRIACVPS